MSLFRATMAVAAISGYAAACNAVIKDGNSYSTTDLAACAALPAWDAAFQSFNVYWRLVPTYARTPDGFIINMINIMGTPS